MKKLDSDHPAVREARALTERANGTGDCISKKPDDMLADLIQFVQRPAFVPDKPPAKGSLSMTQMVLISYIAFHLLKGVTETLNSWDELAEKSKEYH